LCERGEGLIFESEEIDPDPPQSSNSKKRQKEKHRDHKFAEGWVEFEDKRVARSVAEMLNANPIGSFDLSHSH
jgi:ESF2/ABP1 family protein